MNELLSKIEYLKISNYVKTPYGCGIVTVVRPVGEVNSEHKNRLFTYS